MRAILIMLGGLLALVSLVLGVLALLGKAKPSVAVILLLVALSMISVGKGL